MKYAVRLENSAIADLAAVPPVLRPRVQEGVAALGLAPTGLRNADTNPAEFGRVHEFSFAHDDMTCWVRVLYQFGQDELTLHVRRIRWEVL